MKHKINSAAQLKEVIPSTKRIEYACGNGLFFVVNPSDKKTWTAKYEISGERLQVGIGNYPDITWRKAHSICKAIQLLIESNISLHLLKNEEAVIEGELLEQTALITTETSDDFNVISIDSIKSTAPKIIDPVCSSISRSIHKRKKRTSVKETTN